MNKINTITYGYINSQGHHVSVQCDVDPDDLETHYIEVGGVKYKAKGYHVCINLQKKKQPA